ncbi:cell wall-binding repeat-containing protein [Gephyromycinifex aptenodytis]|uniref:cell wall-binding repeat-containing protein n=1 Tax=Gephyromycinifex aptenodytis TaxID=2716227 RepID=UPI001446C0D0|nr:cell wall-binding repeat-containing protein [Gephyromycinifex aptenodytis]
MKPFLRSRTAALSAVLALAATPAVALPAQASPDSLRAEKADERLAGADRFATAAAVSRYAHPSGSRIVFLAAGQDYPDALAAGPAAHASGAPILLTGRDLLPPATATELARLHPDRVYVLGGPAVVSDKVGFDARNAAKASLVYRVDGKDRYATAARVTEVFPPSADTVYLASGEGFADALSGGVAAAKARGSVLLTGKRTLPEVTKERLSELAPSSIVVLGGTGAIDEATFAAIGKAAPKATVTRVAGLDRYDTARQVAARFWPKGSRSAFIASGAIFPDALSGVPAAAAADGPILLTGASCHPAATANAIRSLKTTSNVTLGGRAVAYAGARVCTTGAAKPLNATPPPGPNARTARTVNCADFPHQKAAQQWFDYWYPRVGDKYRLDRDNDRVACELLP